MSLFPVVKRIFAQTIGIDIVSVQPMDGISLEERYSIIAKKRRNKLNIVQGKEVEEIPESKSKMSNGLLYFDWKIS